MVEFEDLRFIYDGKILFEHFTETIRTGEKVVFSGVSGTGKSTLLNSIAGFVVPDAGEIRVDGLAVKEKNLSAIRAQMAWVPQDFTLPYQDVNDLFEVIFQLKANREMKPSKEQVLSVFSELGLSEEIYGKRLVEISGGQRQRVMLAVSVLLNKKMILLDEPTSALDAESVSGVVRFLKRTGGRTIVAVSHDAGFTNAFDRVIRLN